MTRIKLIPIGILLLLIAGCKEPVPSSGPPAPTSAPTLKAGTDSPDAPPPAAVVSKRAITGEGITEDNQKVTISLTVQSDNTVSGTFALASNTLQIRGIVDDDTLRCWLGSTTSRKDLWMGTLMATTTNKIWTGHFAISDSGATTIVKGTWKAES